MTLKLIEATLHSKSTIVIFRSQRESQRIQATISRVHLYFVKIMNGLPGKSVAVQNLWRAALTNFLQRSPKSIPHVLVN